MYQYKTELDGKNLPFGFPQKSIDEVVNKFTKRSQNNEDADIINNYDR